MILRDFKNEFEKTIKKNDKVFITPHKEADFDAIASAIGLALIAKKFEKPTYILIADNPDKLDASIKLIMDEYKDKVGFISMDKFLELKGKDDLLICTDVNKKYLIPCERQLRDFKNVVVIDHHQKDDKSIKANLELILDDVSSVSETIPDLLSYFGIKYDKNLATYLLAGIYLDTDKLRKNASPKTLHVVARLREHGGDMDKINEFFEEDFYSDRKVQALVNNSNFDGYSIVVSCDENEDALYTKEEIAKAADYSLKFKVDASISIGKIDNEVVAVSARSKGKIDVAKIMAELGGGGNQINAAAKITGSTVKDVNAKVLQLIRPYFYINNNEKQ